MSNILSEVHPELIAEWSDKNLPLTPDKITYTCREIGEQIGATDKQVAAMVSKARKFLKSRKDVLDLAGNI